MSAAEPAVSGLVARDLVVAYETGSQPALNGMSIHIETGEFLAVLGPSGSGKSTLLRVIAGFVSPRQGEVRMNGRDITLLSPRERNFGVVFQSYALFPHMTVEQNVAFGLKARRLPSSRVTDETQRALSMVGMQAYARQRAGRLSGGQQQRVALARALVIQPSLLLMDEPLAALDLRLRHSIQEEIKQLQSELSITTLYITHDQEEAFTLADRVLIMNEGKVSAEGPTETIYRYPGSEFAARFLGYNTILEVGADFADGQSITGLPGQSSPLRLESPRTSSESRLFVVIPPDRLAVFEQPAPGRQEILVKSRRFVGTRYLVTAFAGTSVFHFEEPAWRPSVGAAVYVSWDPEGIQLVEERVDGSSAGVLNATNTVLRR